jgi:hypothetical protein
VQLAAQTLEAYFTGGGLAREHEQPRVYGEQGALLVPASSDG